MAGQSTQFGSKLLRRCHEAHVARDRFKQHAGDLVAARAEQLPQGLDVVVLQHQRVLGATDRHPGAGGHAQGQRA